MLKISKIWVAFRHLRKRRRNLNKMEQLQMEQQQKFLKMCQKTENK